MILMANRVHVHTCLHRCPSRPVAKAQHAAVGHPKAKRPPQPAPHNSGILRSPAGVGVSDAALQHACDRHTIRHSVAKDADAVEGTARWHHPHRAKTPQLCLCESAVRVLHMAHRGLDADDAVEAGRHATRASSVGAQGKCSQPCRHRHRAACASVFQGAVVLILSHHCCCLQGQSGRQRRWGAHRTGSGCQPAHRQTGPCWSFQQICHLRDVCRVYTTAPHHHLLQ